MENLKAFEEAQKKLGKDEQKLEEITKKLIESKLQEAEQKLDKSSNKMKIQEFYGLEWQIGVMWSLKARIHEKMEIQVHQVVLQMQKILY